MEEIIISSHGGRLNQNFQLPANCELRFYNRINTEIDLQAQLVFNDLITGNVVDPQPVDTIIGPIQTENYFLEYGHNFPNEAGVFRKVNNFIRINDMTSHNGITLERLVDRYRNINDGEQTIFHCLFCRV